MNVIIHRVESESLTGVVWSEPKPIQAPLHQVPFFDPETLLPSTLREWVMDEAERMPCPPDFIAAAVVVALGSVIGARCAIKPKSQDNWLVIPNLWGGIVAPPSSKKSPAINAAFRPLNRLIAKAEEQYKADNEDFEATKTIYDARRDAHKLSLKKAASKDRKSNTTSLESLASEFYDFQKEKPTEPTKRRYKTNDSTVEKLGELLQQNPSGLLVTRDELVGLLISWERHGHEGDRAFFLEAWNGDSAYDTDRIGRGSISIPNLCVSIFGGIQPEKLIGYLEQASYALGNDGMLQRFQILVYPDERTWEWKDIKPNQALYNDLISLFERLSDFDPLAWGASDTDNSTKFPHFCFDEKAQEIFIAWTTELHMERIPNETHPIIAEHLSKYDKLFPTLALIFHLVDCAASGLYGPVRGESAYRAAAWCEYLEHHARRIYGLLIDDGLRAAQALAEKIKNGKLSNGFTARDISRNQWRYLTKEESIQAALAWLEDEYWIRGFESGGTGPGTGRPTIRYTINPNIKIIASKGDVK